MQFSEHTVTVNLHAPQRWANLAESLQQGPRPPNREASCHTFQLVMERERATAIRDDDNLLAAAGVYLK